VACPVSTTLGYLKGVLPEGAASDWVAAIARRAFGLYLRRLLALHALQDAATAGGAPTKATRCGQSVAAACLGERPLRSACGPLKTHPNAHANPPLSLSHPFRSSPAAARAAAAPPALAYAEQLARALIAHLADGAAAPGGPDAPPARRRGLLRKRAGPAAPDLATIADGMIVKLLAAFPALLHSRRVHAALLAQLQREEGDTGLSALAASRRGAVWERTQAVVRAAADAAPATTEAIVHSFLGSGGVMPDGVIGGPGGAGAGEASGTGARGGAAGATLIPGKPRGLAGARGGAAALSTAASERLEAAARQAALRRAADLLRICGDARAARGGYADEVDGDGGAYQGTLALARKLHYSGYVRGLIAQALGGAGGHGARGGECAPGARGASGDGDSVVSTCSREAAAVREVRGRGAGGARDGENMPSGVSVQLRWLAPQQTDPWLSVFRPF
jgi:hypothetical protein